MAHVVVTTTPPVLDCLGLKKCCTLMLRTISTHRKALNLKFLQRKHVPPFPSNSFTRNTVAKTGEGKALITKTATMFIEADFREGLSLNRQAHSKPNQPCLLSTSHNSWHSICQKREILSPDPCNPMTCNASLLTLRSLPTSTHWNSVICLFVKIEHLGCAEQVCSTYGLCCCKCHWFQTMQQSTTWDYFFF